MNVEDSIHDSIEAGAETTQGQRVGPDASKRAQASNREAIVFIPGLGGRQSVDDIAFRLATAFDLNAGDAKAKFALTDHKSEDFGQSSLNTRKVTIVRKKDDSSGPGPQVDLFGFNCSETLTRDIKQRNLLVQAAFALVALVIMFPRAVRALLGRNRSKPWSDRVQVLLSIGWSASLVCIYIGILVAAILTVVLSANSEAPIAETEEIQRGSDQGQSGFDTPNAKGPSQPNAIKEIVTSLAEWRNGPISRYSQRLIVILAALGIFVSGWKSRIIESAIQTIAVNLYLTTGYRRSAAQGQLECLIEHIVEDQERNGTPYDRVHVMAYSFGSTIALDTLFPHDGETAQRIRRVDTLVTIGCPFNTIESIWRDYFQARESQGYQPHNWINVYSPIDSFGSNFQDSEGEPLGFPSQNQEDGPIQPTQQILFGGARAQTRVGRWGTLGRMLLMRGLQAHSVYFGRELENDKDCFSVVLPRMYEGHAMMQ